MLLNGFVFSCNIPNIYNHLEVVILVKRLAFSEIGFGSMYIRKE